MKILFTFLLSGMFLFLAHTAATACSLNPTAKIVTDPSGSTFFHGESVVFDGTTSTANCGSIDQYRWRVRPVGGSYTTVSWNSVYSHTFTLEPHEGEKDYQVQLRVRNTGGNYGFKTITVTVKRHYTRQYYLTDHLGSVRVTVNEQGDPVGWDDYYPFGLQMPGRTQNASNPNDDSKFTGYLLEQEGDLGIYHAEARLYDPVIGRFMSVDPLADEFPSWSPFNYTMNNPLNFIDPDGRAPIAIPIIIKGVKAAVAAIKAKSVVSATAGAGTAFAQGTAASGLIISSAGILSQNIAYDNLVETWPPEQSQLEAGTLQDDPGNPFNDSMKRQSQGDRFNNFHNMGGNNGNYWKIVGGTGIVTATAAFLNQITSDISDSSERQLEAQRREEMERQREAQRILDCRQSDGTDC